MSDDELLDEWCHWCQNPISDCECSLDDTKVDKSGSKT